MTSPRHAVPSAPGGRTRAGWQAVAAAATSTLMLAIYLADRSFYLVDDKRNQYLPVAMDIGRRLTSGEWLPVIDPALGPSGNYSLDIQYGVYDPSHWLVDVALSRFSDLPLAAFLWALVFAVVLCAGTTALAHRLGMSGPWGAAAGVAAASSGWVLFWLAPDWAPGLVSLAWVPWVWWAWTGAAGRLRIRDCLGIAGFSYLVVAGGWPSTWMALGLLVAGLVVEAWVGRPSASASRDLLEQTALRLVAALAGIVSAGLFLLPLLHAGLAHVTAREGGISNDNVLIANLWDVVSFAAPQLNGDIATASGDHTLASPIFFACWFAVVVLWCVRWTGLDWRRPGLVTAGVGCLGMVLLTQAPSTVGPLRDEIRQLGGAQLFFCVGVCALASSGAWVVTRTRVVGALATVAAMGFISWSRTPGGPSTFAGVLLVVAAAGLLIAVGVRFPRFTAATAIVSTVGLTLVAFGFQHRGGVAAVSDVPDRLTPGALRLTPADEPVLAVYGAGTPADWVQWQADGVGRGFSDLRAGGRVAPGYSSVSQRAFRSTLCITAAQGQGCPSEVERLFQREPVTQVPWVDLLGYRTVVVAGAARQRAFEQAAGPQWSLRGTAVAFDAYQRAGPASIAGRITHVVGQAAVSAVSVSNQTQTYTVSSRHGARLVFRDLYWPGYVATLDGRAVPVRPLDGMLLTVQLPPGAHGTLRVAYEPLSTRALVLLPALSVVLLAAACGRVGQRRTRRRGRHRAAGGQPE